ncbi:uncharacterized protein BT62DRAFT_1000606 [Guyanagaster necrorhizus]|uniref:Uncharacterized protein n=1 Tax=Guyanagaster necrorhizus TaxID=856835 RepID=A0A9P7W2T0_9AGAR|nr:uncharacterized protein BT62DRAFT_1000606 [Guyanagaster necrorhizus MCA 3950]KAG7451360.1 hypothetical protein BT62DRAFT_1000606 [Guyanagaster necrorhizus MCA 3950]
MPLHSLRKRKIVRGDFHFYAPVLDYRCGNFLLVPHPSTLFPEFIQRITFVILPLLKLPNEYISQRKLKRHLSLRDLSKTSVQVSGDRDPSASPSKSPSRESRHLRRSTRRIVSTKESTPVNLELPLSLAISVCTQVSTHLQQVHRSHSHPRISESFEIDLSSTSENTPVFENDEEVGSNLLQPSFILKSISCQDLGDQSVMTNSPVFSPTPPLPCSNAAPSVPSIPADLAALDYDSSQEVGHDSPLEVTSSLQAICSYQKAAMSNYFTTVEDMAWISKTSKKDVLLWHHRTSQSSF